MTRVLATFGDSWPEGAELRKGDRRYGEIIRDSLEFNEFYNYGSAGASNEHMLYQLQDHLTNHHRDHHDTTAIFFLTNPARTKHFPHHMSWDVAANWHPDAHQQIKEIYLHFHDSKHEVIRNSTAISALQHWSDRFSIKDYYFAGWVRYEQWSPGVDLDRIWAQGRETAADWFGASKHNGEHLLEVKDNIYITPNFAHPNQLGHDLIASKLMGWITKPR